MASINKVMLLGNIGRDPEVRYTQGGRPVANFSIATSERWKDRDGNRQERTEWHRIVAWGPKAEFVQNYLKKGSAVFVEGKLQTRDWTDKQDVKHYTTEIVADDIQFAGPPPDGQRQGGSNRPSGQSGQSSQSGGYGGGPPPGPPEEEGYLEDDIPF